MNGFSKYLNFQLLDTPGFENENRTKPEETKIISGGGGLARPDKISEKILNDSLVKKFDRR